MAELSNEKKSLSLYHLGIEHERLFSELYDMETGEERQDVKAQLDALFPTTEKKCIGVVNWIRKREADIRELAFIQDELKKRQAAYEAEINRNKANLISNMQRCQISRIECAQFTIKLSENQPSTDILDEKLIPERFMKKREIVKVEIKPDKNAIKEEVIATGIQIDGAYVHRKPKLTIDVEKI